LKKLILLAMFVVMGLAFAKPEAPEYILNQYEKARCMHDAAGGMGQDICSFTDCCEPGCPGYNTYSEMGNELLDLMSSMEDQNYPMVAQQYAYIVSLFSEMRGMYLQYGIEYVLGLGPQGSMGELMNSFAGYQGRLLGCFGGGGEVPPP